MVGGESINGNTVGVLRQVTYTKSPCNTTTGSPQLDGSQSRSTSNVIKLSDGFVSHVESPRCSATSTGVSSAGTNDGGAFG
jgi:hypothetical protein